MTSNRIAYTSLVAFVSVVLTLVVVNLVQGSPDTSSASAGGSASDEAVYRLDQVAEHNHAGSCWKVIDGVVYDLTEYLPNHPTEEEVFTRWCGKEATLAWLDKGNGRPHSPRAAARLENYRIGVIEGGSPAPAPAVSAVPSPKPVTGDDNQGRMILGLAPGNYLDGTYRGNFIDRGQNQVGLQFRLEAGRIKGMSYRQLFYRDQDYLKLDDTADLYPVLRQYQQLAERLEGEPVEAIFRLYQAENVVDDIDGYSGATLRGAKVISAFRDGLNRGVYSW